MLLFGSSSPTLLPPSPHCCASYGHVDVPRMLYAAGKQEVACSLAVLAFKWVHIEAISLPSHHLQIEERDLLTSLPAWLQTFPGIFPLWEIYRNIINALLCFPAKALIILSTYFSRKSAKKEGAENIFR